MAPPVHNVQPTNQHKIATCSIGANLINTYGSAYLDNGDNRPGLCIEMALETAHSRGVMADDVGLDMRKSYIASQQGICEFAV